MRKTTMKMSRRNSCLLAAIIAAAFPILAEGVVVPRPAIQQAAKAAATASRLVELPSSVEDGGDNNDAVVGNNNKVSATLGVGEESLPLPASSTEERLVELPRNRLSAAVDGILPSTSTPSSDAETEAKTNSNRRLTTIDGTSSTITYANAIRQAEHEKLLTSYKGNIPSSSAEFSLRNHRTDGRYVLVGSMGLNVHMVRGAGEKGEGEEICRVRVYTKRLGDITAEDAQVDASAEYEEALDATVLCAGQGKETLLPSDLFLESYRRKQVEQAEKRNAIAQSLADEIRLPLSLKEDGNRKLSLGDESLHRKLSDEGGGNVENLLHGTVADISDNGDAANAEDVTAPDVIYGLTPEDKLHPLLIAPNEAISVYLIVQAAEDAPEGTSFFLLSSAESANGGSTTLGATTTADSIETGALYITDTSLQLHEGSSIFDGYLVDDNESPANDEGTNAANADAAAATEKKNALKLTSPTVFNGAVYYDLLEPSETSLAAHYDQLEYGLLPGNAINNLPGCDKSISTGYIDTVGSYGIMMDVSNTAVDDPNSEDFFDRFKDIEIYGMDLYMRNFVNASFDVYVRNDGPQVGSDKLGYVSYSSDPTGQTLIDRNWDRVARGVVEGKGPHVPSPIPPESWHKNVIIKPGEVVGFYVTVKEAPDLRYRNTSLAEGDVYATDGVLNVGVGRAWGEFPLRGDGTDVYFAPREFAGSFKYHAHEGLCESTAPSSAPTFPSNTPVPSISSVPTREVEHSYSDVAEEQGLCPEESELETTFHDGTGSYGALFDMLAKTNLTLTGIDLNIDWNTGLSADVLIYARQGSWFGHQNNAESWPYLLVNHTLRRPADFHNRSIDGPYIPIDTKRNSARVPDAAFTPLKMEMGTTWSLYICTSLADIRYTLGTSIGKTFAYDDNLRVMEGAGAADYPPFQGATPGSGGVEYTFYAPRVFNGNLHYDYVAECPSEAPSSVYYTPVPTPTPTLTTSVSYTFYVEHSPVIQKGEVTDDMRYGVRKVLDDFLGGKEDILRGYVVNHELVIVKVEANMVSPADIGYLCYPTPPQACTSISVDVTVTHRATATTDEVTYALLRQSMHLPALIDVEGYTIEYVGDRAVETNSEITISGVPKREMGESEQEFFENAARAFLDSQVQQAGDESAVGSLRILSVTVNGQEITSSESEVSLQGNTMDQSASVMPVRNNSGRRLEKGSNSVKVSVRGKYRPPPEVDLGEFVEDSVNRDRELLEKELNKPLALQDKEDKEGEELSEEAPSSYFAEAEVVGARDLEDEDPSLMAGVTGTFVSKEQQEEDAFKSLLNMMAMAVGGLILLLSAMFFLRPHRRRVIFGGKNMDNQRRKHTQAVDVEDQNLLKKSRAMIRGWGSEGLTDSGNSFPGASQVGNEKNAYDLRGSTNSERGLALSNFSHGQQGFDPQGSGTSSNRQAFDPTASGTSRTMRNNLNGSFTRGGGLNRQHQTSLSNTSGPPASLQGSFTRGTPAQPPPQYGMGPGPGPHQPPQTNPFSRPGGIGNGPPYQPVSSRRPPPGHNPGAGPMMNQSMPPIRGGPHHGPGRPMNQSMPPQRGGGESMPPRVRRVSQDGGPPRGSFVGGHGMSMTSQQRGPLTGSQGATGQNHDPRRNQSMRPQHHHR